MMDEGKDFKDLFDELKVVGEIGKGGENKVIARLLQNKKSGNVFLDVRKCFTDRESGEPRFGKGIMLNWEQAHFLADLLVPDMFISWEELDKPKFKKKR